jgi:hypothetical protein
MRGSKPGERRGGRRKGGRNKKTREQVERAEASGVVPLDYMLAIMRDETAPLDLRCDMAKAAAPFVHPRLTATKISGDPDAPLFDLTTLTDNELVFLRRVILKAQQVEE